jgi:Restriction endonuclease NaeI
MSHAPLDPSHQDFSILSTLEQAILSSAGGFEDFSEMVTHLFRQAFDEVIDAPRTNRFTLQEIEKTEKTYIGTKVEILLRSALGMPKGAVLDLLVGGTEVDIKMTTQRDWMIPRESIGRPAVLMKADERNALCDVGLVVCRPEYMRASNNQDKKGQIAAAHYGNIWWLLRRQPYPKNFWEVLPRADRDAIMNAGTGKWRLAELFERIQGQPISRSQVQAIGQQHDYMKRLRKNGGARDILGPKQIAILWGSKDRDLIESFGLGPVSKEEFVSYLAKTPEEIALLRARDHID